MFIVTIYCHDRNETIDEAVFDTFDEARDFIIEQAKKMRMNTSIRISDYY